MHTICTNQAPGAISPYAQAVAIDHLIFTSGQLPKDALVEIEVIARL